MEEKKAVSTLCRQCRKDIKTNGESFYHIHTIRNNGMYVIKAFILVVISSIKFIILLMSWFRVKEK